ncbi:MAG: peptidoglycan-binding protein [Aminipila sp.]
MAGTFDPFVGQPIRSVQTYLRRISQTYKTVPAVIPDGEYGEQTKTAVLGFQKSFGLKQTGEVNKETWDRILLIYNDIMEYEGDPLPAVLYPSGKYVILPGEKNVNLYVIQSMMFVLQSHYSNIPGVDINGVNDDKTTAAVKAFQKVFGLQENGVIDKQFWDRLSSLYQVKIPQNRF